MSDSFSDLKCRLCKSDRVCVTPANSVKKRVGTTLWLTSTFNTSSFPHRLHLITRRIGTEQRQVDGVLGHRIACLQITSM